MHYKHVHTVLLVKPPSQHVAFPFCSKIAFMVEIIIPIIIIIMIITIIIIIIIGRVNDNDNSNNL